MKGLECASILIGLLCLLAGGARGDGGEGEGANGTLPVPPAATNSTDVSPHLQAFRELHVDIAYLKNSEYIKNLCNKSSAEYRDCTPVPKKGCNVDWFLFELLREKKNGAFSKEDSEQLRKSKVNFKKPNGDLDHDGICNLIKTEESTEEASRTDGSQSPNDKPAVDNQATGSAENDTTGLTTSSENGTVTAATRNETGASNSNAKNDTDSINPTGEGSNIKQNQNPASESESVSHLYWILPVLAVCLILMAFAGVYIHRYTKRAGFRASAKTPAEPTKNDGSDV